MITNSWLIWGILAAATGFSIWASNNTKWGKFLGYVNVAIIIGAIISNVGILPVSSGPYFPFKELNATVSPLLSGNFTSGSVLSVLAMS